MAQNTTLVRNDALARATALANRARDLRRAQSEVQELTAREVKVLAHTAASFFDSIPLPEFTSTLLPQSARRLRRIRHRILHRTIHNTDTGTLIRALLLGRDGMLRLFSARSADSRELLLILEPGRTLPVGVMRDVVDWTPTLRVPGFRPFEILGKLSQSLDAVEDQIGEAELRVQVQKAALASGNLSALLTVPPVPPPELSSTLERHQLTAGGQTETAVTPEVPVAVSVSVARDPFDVFEMVEAVANSVPAAERKAAESTLPHVEVHDEPDEWDKPVEPPVNKPGTAHSTHVTRSRRSA